MVVRDRSSNARSTVATILQEGDLQAAPPLAEAGTPQAAMREARARNAPGARLSGSFWWWDAI